MSSYIKLKLIADNKIKVDLSMFTNYLDICKTINGQQNI